jgi:hypothetical protein
MKHPKKSKLFFASTQETDGSGTVLAELATVFIGYGLKRARVSTLAFFCFDATFYKVAMFIHIICLCFNL